MALPPADDTNCFMLPAVSCLRSQKDADVLGVSVRLSGGAKGTRNAERRKTQKHKLLGAIFYISSRKAGRKYLCTRANSQPSEVIKSRSAEVVAASRLHDTGP